MKLKKKVRSTPNHYTTDEVNKKVRSPTNHYTTDEVKKKVRSTTNHYTTDEAKRGSDLPLTITPLMKLKTRGSQEPVIAHLVFNLTSKVDRKWGCYT